MSLQCTDCKSALSDSIVFHAGTTTKGGKVVTNGGRVLAITSYGPDFKTALAISYKNVKKLNFDKMYYRTALGFDLQLNIPL